MVVIRLQRRGTSKLPHHRIVVTEKSRAQNSRVLEIIGQYNPAGNPERFELKESRFISWVSSGAQVSETVTRLVKRFKKISVGQLRV